MDQEADFWMSPFQIAQRDNAMKPRQARRSSSHSRLLAGWLILLFTAFGLVGCGPTHTAGTSGMAAKELSILSITQLPKEAHLQVRTIQFDGAGDAYEIGKGRDFYLLPRNHTASFTLTASVPDEIGLPTWLIPKKALTFPGPQQIPLGDMTADKAYELALPSEGFDKFVQTGEISLLREKAK